MALVLVRTHDAGRAMKRPRRRHESTAYHEAGHAVAAFVLRLKIGRRGVTIVPDKERDMLGYVNITAQLRERPDCATSARTRARIEALGGGALGWRSCRTQV